MRQAVYERARSALARQLTSVEPPLPADEIEGHHQALEEAIDTVETEFAEAGGYEEPDEEPEREAEPPPPPERAAPVPAPAAARPVPEPKPAEKPAAPKAEEARPQEPQPFKPSPYQPRPQEPKAAEPKAGEPKTGEQKNGEPKPGAPKNGDAKPAPVAAPLPGPAGRKPDDGKKVAGAPGPAGKAEPGPAGKGTPAPGGKDKKGPADDAPPPYPSERVETSRAPALVAFVLIVLILGGVGALAYTQWDTIVTAYHDITDQSGRTASDENAGSDTAGTDAGGTGTAGSGMTSSEQAAEAPSSPLTGVVEADRVEGKDEDRLLSGPATTPAPSPSTAEEQPMDMGTDEPAPDAEAGAGTELAGPAPSSEQAAPLVGQRAIFYEQGADGAAGQAVNGAVSWTSVEKDDGSPAIQATIDIPDRNSTVTITMSKNSDVALPASHLIEIAFSGVLVDGTTVQRVPALVLKPNEQARGQPLAGAAVDVTGDLFWIALSDTPDQVDRNLELLRSGSWFDLPILFNSGQRALITFEKGIPGDKVFENVMQQWAP
ncbi:hypothetical protein [Afifella sp. IM 167]|uniref:hypothetical protein n=1 Tax=Afifella sp. IM 167 TaxID=2033586 RepID=UPI001CCD0878|nr:hypothetical protein [Afifella sp. IM 167]MBZ8135312.1 hypothetical protein [Afifella sp. IM 167]